MFFRDYCNDLKISDNNTEFLLNFNEFIDRKTPNNPSCKYAFICNHSFTVFIFKVVKSWFSSVCCYAGLFTFCIFNGKMKQFDSIFCIY